MKKLIILLTICFTLFNCTVNKKPEFIGLENIKVIKSTSKHITLSADALFINPNDIGGELKTDSIKVLINNNEMATISTKKFKVPSKKEFIVPLETSIPTDSIFNNKSLGSLIGSLFNKKIKVQYKGDIIYKTLGLSYTYNVDKTENIKIKF